jgi:hypothetical protein
LHLLLEEADLERWGASEVGLVEWAERIVAE